MPFSPGARLSCVVARFELEIRRYLEPPPVAVAHSELFAPPPDCVFEDAVTPAAGSGNSIEATSWPRADFEQNQGNQPDMLKIKALI
jgi:hypothetical protein